jgi:hypothetical protein
VQFSVVQQPILLAPTDEGAVGKITQERLVRGAFTVDQAALGVQDGVHVVGARFRRESHRCCPCGPELLVVGVPAFGARTMPGGQRDGLIEEEQFGVSPWLQDLPASAPEFQHADQPATHLVAPDQDEVVVVQDAPVAVHGSAVLGGDQVTGGCDPVAQRMGHAFHSSSAWPGGSGAIATSQGSCRISASPSSPGTED